MPIRIARLVVGAIALLPLTTIGAHAADRKLRAEGRAPAAKQARAFPASTTIYVVSGVRDSGGADNTGTASVVHCTNVSGASVSVRVVALYSGGGLAGSQTRTILNNGGTQTFSTHGTVAYIEDVSLATGQISQGAFNIEATSASVFCSAMTIDATTSVPIGVPLHMVRVNSLPGTQE